MCPMFLIRSILEKCKYKTNKWESSRFDERRIFKAKIECAFTNIMKCEDSGVSKQIRYRICLDNS